MKLTEKTFSITCWLVLEVKVISGLKVTSYIFPSLYKYIYMCILIINSVHSLTLLFNLEGTFVIICLPVFEVKGILGHVHLQLC